MSEAARKALQMIPEGYQFKDPLIRESIEKGRVEGRVEGQISSILDVFDARGMQVPPDCRAKIVACRDEQQLAVWLKRAITVSAVEELFIH